MAVGVATAGHPICKLTLPNAVPVIFNGLRLGLVVPLSGVFIMLAHARPDRRRHHLGHDLAREPAADVAVGRRGPALQMQTFARTVAHSQMALEGVAHLV